MDLSLVLIHGSATAINYFETAIILPLDCPNLSNNYLENCFEIGICLHFVLNCDLDPRHAVDLGLVLVTGGDITFEVDLVCV